MPRHKEVFSDSVRESFIPVEQSLKNHGNQSDCEDCTQSIGDSLTQTITIENNTGIAGIQGNGHTITINQCPQEIIDFIKRLMV